MVIGLASREPTHMFERTEARRDLLVLACRSRTSLADLSQATENHRLCGVLSNKSEWWTFRFWGLG